jgi:DNA-binding GntR family transcriptional regulator
VEGYVQAGLNAPMDLERIKRPRSLTLLIADRIRDLIVQGDIELGALLSENELAARLGVSRTPVREALQRLETERLVHVQPQRGTFVFQFEESELEQTFEMREILEAGALRLCLRQDRDRLIEKLEAELAKGKDALARSAEEFRAADAAFHWSIVESSRNQDLVEAYGRINGRVRALLNRLARTDEELKGSQKDHEQIVRNIRNQQDEDALESLRWHMNGLPRMYSQKFKTP